MKNSSTGILFAAGSLLLLLSSQVVHAVPVSYTYTGSWTSFVFGDFGANYSATVILDNGGNTVANQLFTQADFVSATVVSGSYNETALPAHITGWTEDFNSDALGQLANGWFDALLPNGDQWHFDTYTQDEGFYTLNNGSAGFFSSHISNPGTLVPEPPTLGLIALGLCSLCGLIQPRTRRA
jgi:hypothetical protein